MTDMKKEYQAPLMTQHGTCLSEPLCASLVGASTTGLLGDDSYTEDYGKERTSSDAWSGDGLW